MEKSRRYIKVHNQTPYTEPTSKELLGEDGQQLHFDTEEELVQRVDELNRKTTSPYVWYSAVAWIADD